jgi:phenylalanyl-tRNA synthetase beta subunit
LILLEQVNFVFKYIDILHPVDLAEDIGISYGYNKIENKIPSSFTVGT